MYTVTMAFDGQSKDLHIIADIFSLDDVYLAGKSPLLVRNKLLNLWDILPKTSKSSKLWDIGENFHLIGLSNKNAHLP